MTDQKNEAKYMPLIDHIKELRNRTLLTFAIFIISCFICLIYVQDISLFIERPALNIKFLQLTPGEYLFVSIKIAIYLAAVVSSPFGLYQVIQFISPGLTEEENKYIIPTAIGSLILFFIGTIFSYEILIPITLNFFIKYGSDIVEPIWSFNEYFNFISLTLFTTGICFQIPIIQIILGLNKILAWESMLKNWKYIAFTSTIVSAVITPSTDPITQLFLTGTILFLYLSGIFILKNIEKPKG
uniref:Sec-independent protein translocase component TatC n=1 Tax=Polysiphonia sertularioides TaxID=945028 RepID=A0A1Z1M8T3_9FLOR|nr:Sec-independent protein translocase component TatC [Polysiphonia sertularioides]ARW62498.1 Sec-independent protein translocase component TatC [Polysiphonia sertularioides]